MKGLLWILLCSLMTLLADEGARSKELKGDDFGFLALGYQTSAVRFKQEGNYNSGTANESWSDEFYTTNSSPYYATGSYFRVNKTIDFSLMAASNFFYSESSLGSTDPDAGSEDVKMMLTDFNFQLYYKLNQNNAMTFGFDYEYNTFNMKSKSIGAGAGLMSSENDVSIITPQIGYMWRNKDITGKEGFNYRFGASLGIPLFEINSINNNPSSGETQFSFSYGFEVNPTAYIGYAFFNGFEVGVYIDYLYRQRYNKVTYDYVGTLDDGTQFSATNTFSGFKTNRVIYMLAVAYNF